MSAPKNYAFMYLSLDPSQQQDIIKIRYSLDANKSIK